MSAEPLSWSVPKNARDEIRVELSHWNGSDRLNVRVWVAKDAGMIATKQGFTLPMDRALGFCEAVTNALRVARERGLIS
jgi:hypothetical protein